MEQMRSVGQVIVIIVPLSAIHTFVFTLCHLAQGSAIQYGAIHDHSIQINVIRFSFA
jgi:hypothetical protein